MLKGNAIVGQSGGPTSVINASVAGVVDACKKSEKIENIYAMRYGIEGFIAENIIDLTNEPSENIKGLKTTPSSALGSCRHKLQDQDLPKVLDVLKRANIRYMFLIGGNDTMDTICRIEAYAKQNGYELAGIGIPKTVDNDLFGTDHTPGFPSAARYIALSVMQAGVLARDMQKVDQFCIFQAIGREAGWLVAAAALGKSDELDAPHVLCFPERPFDKQKFLSDVKLCYDKYGFVSIVCGEGITYADGTAVSSSQTKDKFNNIEFGAMGGTSVAMVLHRMIADEFGFRGEFQITESLSMCAADRAVQLDIEESYKCGFGAVQLAMQSQSGYMVTLKRTPNCKGYNCELSKARLSDVAIKAKPMPDEFINDQGNFVTRKFIEYAKDIVGPLPKYTRLSNKKVELK